jgi:hypothetical protein
MAKFDSDDRAKEDLPKCAAKHQSVATRARKRSILADLKRLGIKPEEPIDQKKLIDEMWDEGLL